MIAWRSQLRLVFALRTDRLDAQVKFQIMEMPSAYTRSQNQQTRLTVVEARKRIQAIENLQNVFHPRPHQDPRAYVVQRQERFVNMTSKHGKMEFENKITFDSHQLCLNHLETSDQNAYLGMQVFHLTAHCTEKNEVKFAFQLCWIIPL